MTSLDEVRAAAPQAPSPTRALLRAQVEQAARKQQRAELERRAIVRGLLLFAAIVLVVNIARAASTAYSCRAGGGTGETTSLHTHWW